LAIDGGPDGASSEGSEHGRGVAQELRTARDTSARTTKRGEGCDMTVMATTLLGEAGKADAVACTEIRRHGA